MGLGSNSVLSTIIHADLHKALPLFYPSEVVIQRGTVTLQPNGEQVLTWSTVCEAWGNMAQRPMTERRGTEKTTAPGGWALNLKGHYPDVRKTDRALVGGVEYNITDVVHDSLGESTRLDLEITTH